MKVKKIKVPFYKWVVVSIEIENYSDKEEVIKKMRSLKMRTEDIDSIGEMIDNEAHDGAACHHHPGKLLCVIITFPHTKRSALVGTLLHEGRHAVDKIIETTGLEGDEAAAYLSEYVQLKLISDYIKD